MSDLISQQKQHLGLVSLDVPLLSNLAVWANIMLTGQYHHNLKESEARQIALECLERFDLGHLRDVRDPALDRLERFCVMLLRAAMVDQAIIVIDRPFRLVPYLKDIRFVTNALKLIDDLFQKCYIWGYYWDKDRFLLNEWLDIQS